jgi:hypothetical protein
MHDEHALVQFNRAGMFGEEIADDIDPGGNDFLLPQPSLQPEFRRKLIQDIANWQKTISLLFGFRESAPLLEDSFTQGVRHNK